MTEGTLFVIDHVVFSYDAKRVIDDVSFAVTPGEFIGVVGPNGAGKSTLLRLMAGFLRPDKGFITLLGRNLKDYTRRDLAKTVATLPQTTEIPFPYTVEEFILMGRYPHARPGFLYGVEEKGFVDQVMETMEIQHLRGRRINTLSEGERQKAALSQCLAQDPKVLLLDEPVSHLDIRHQIQTFDLLDKLHREGLTIIAVLHDLNLASEYCSRVMLISKGTVMSDGSPGSVLTFQNIEKAYDTIVIVRENPLSGKPFVIPVSRRYLKTG